MDEVKIVKKRGRKPKDKPDVSTKVIEDYVNTNMVLHVPLYDSISDNEAIQKEIDNALESDCHGDMNQQNLIPFDKNMMYMIEFNKDMDIPMSSMNSNANKYINSNVINHTRKLYDTNLFFNDNGLPIENCKSNCVCFWDTEPFHSVPIGLPYKIIKNSDMHQCEKQFKYKYLVYGYFCSFNCAAAYNFSLKDSQVLQRFSLLNNLYEDVYNNSNTIQLAPPREMHKKFGGPFTTLEFRMKSNQSVQYQNIVPPLMSMRCQIEEFYGNMYKKPEQSIITLDDDRIIKAQSNIEKLKLKRSSSIHNNKNNIEKRMGIKILNNTSN